MPLSPEEQSRLEFLRAKKSQEPTLGEKAKAFGYGAAAGFMGGPGELEEFAAYTVPEFARKVVGAKPAPRENMGFGRETLFPTIKEAKQVMGKAGIQPPRKDVQGYETAGEITGGFGTALPSMVKGGLKAVVGVGSKTSEALAQQAERLGFKLSPSQVRQDIPLPAKGAAGFEKENQTLANTLASKNTGKEVKEITSDFISSRLKDLGKEFDKLYKGKSFVVDMQTESALNTILAKESELGYAGVSPVKQTAQTMLEKLSSTRRVDGEDLQRLRNALTERARSSTSRSDAHEIYNLVDIIDQSVGKNNPALQEALSVIRPQYRNSIILEDLYRKGGIKQGNISLEMLGDMLRGKRDAIRRSYQDIDDLAELGRELKLRARWQTEGRGSSIGEDVIGKVFGTGADLASKLLGTRTRAARQVQKAIPYLPETPPILKGLGTAETAGTVVSPLNKDQR